jgi:hypothetical protein
VATVQDAGDTERLPGSGAQLTAPLPLSMVETVHASSIERRVIALLIFFVSAGYLAAATRFSFGALAAPKAGFLPRLVGCSAVILSTINLWFVFRTQIAVKADGSRSRGAVLFVAGLVAYVLLLKPLGYALATALATAYLLKAAGTEGWRLPAVLSISVAVGLYVLFVLVLKIPMP